MARLSCKPHPPVLTHSVTRGRKMARRKENDCFDYSYSRLELYVRHLFKSENPTPLQSSHSVFTCRAEAKVLSELQHPVGCQSVLSLFCYTFGTYRNDAHACDLSHNHLSVVRWARKPTTWSFPEISLLGTCEVSCGVHSFPPNISLLFMSENNVLQGKTSRSVREKGRERCVDLCGGDPGQWIHF